jgi:RNA polymerase sigma-70 factor (ECF subfamily)
MQRNDADSSRGLGAPIDSAVHPSRGPLYDEGMSLPDQTVNSGSARSDRFRTTHWSVVLAAGQGPSPDGRDALASLCQMYWYPVYAYIRRRGHSPDDAQDVAQAFFARLLEKNIAGKADRNRGKFRSFLLASLRHFLANEWRRARAQVRGHGRVVLSLDLATGEDRYALEPAHELTPEKIYERRWALTLLDQTVAKLRDEFATRGKLEQFEHLKAYLGGDPSTAPYAQIASELGTTEGAVKVAVHRLRQRCRELLRAAIAETVSGQEDIDEELRELFEAVAY